MASNDRQRETSSSAADEIELERAYLVCWRDVLTGEFPFAEPIVLVDVALMQRLPGCRMLELQDPPPESDQAPSLQFAVPLFVVEMSAAYQFEGARPAVIARDLRTER